MSPSAVALRSASDMAHDTQVAPLPSSWGCSAAASPPAEPAGTGRPAPSNAKERGPRFEAMTNSALKGNRPHSYADDPTPRLHGTLRTSHHGPVSDDESPRPAVLA